MTDETSPEDTSQPETDEVLPAGPDPEDERRRRNGIGAARMAAIVEELDLPY